MDYDAEEASSFMSLRQSNLHQSQTSSLQVIGKSQHNEQVWTNTNEQSQDMVNQISSATQNGGFVNSRTDEPIRLGGFYRTPQLQNESKRNGDLYFSRNESSSNSLSIPEQISSQDQSLNENRSSMSESSFSNTNTYRPSIYQSDSSFRPSIYSEKDTSRHDGMAFETNHRNYQIGVSQRPSLSQQSGYGFNTTPENRSENQPEVLEEVNIYKILNIQFHFNLKITIHTIIFYHKRIIR